MWVCVFTLLIYLYHKQIRSPIVNFKRIHCTLYRSTNHSYAYIYFDQSEPLHLFWFLFLICNVYQLACISLSVSLISGIFADGFKYPYNKYQLTICKVILELAVSSVTHQWFFSYTSMLCPFL